MGAACHAAGDFPSLTGAPPLVIAHRGASGYLPEHTLEAYRLAIRQGADFIEPDLVSTKDGALIARHEVNIAETTDVADHPEFAARKTRKTIDVATEEGWFADDFTLAEIKTLRAVQRVPFRPQQFNSLFKVPTFREVIKLALQEGERRGRPVGVYPETKHPSYHRSVALPLEGRLVSILNAFNLKTRRDPVIIQSFEVANLKALNTLTGVRLVQLIDAERVTLDGALIPNRPYGDPRTYADLLTDAGLSEIKVYADGIGPWKRYIVSVKGVDQDNDAEPDDVNGDGAVNDADATRLPPTDLIVRAHAAHLFVHPFTFRNEGQFLASDYGANPGEEYLQFYCLGVDGLFSDFADTALSSRHLVGIAPTICNQNP
jgi:glycerophosphoryl diester phosphodiesterase